MTQTAERIGTGPEAGGVAKPFGPAAAAVFFAAGIGAVMLGILTTLAEANASVKSALEWWASVGPLSGKTILSTAGFLVSWPILHVVLRDKDPEPRRVFIWVAILLAIGLLMTFPIFFQAFAPEE